MFCWKVADKGVSILVLLEIGLGVFQMTVKDRLIEVSILVLLEIGLGVVDQGGVFHDGILFQSLFCWKSVWES